MSPSTTSPYHRRPTCRGCGGGDLVCVLELGPQPLANAFPTSPAAFAGEARYPLDLCVCGDCFLVQILDVVDPEVLFREYLYVSGTSRTMNEHFAGYAAHVLDLLELGPEDLAVEVASNDGSLLKHFRDAGTRVLGIEPARNVTELSRAIGLETMNEFFDAECAKTARERYGPAAVVMANNVFAHVDEPSGFLVGCRTMLGEGGYVIIEVPYLADMLERLEYDTIYHEHLSYFSITALLPLFARSGLSIVRIDHHPVHGGSLRIHAKRREDEPEHSAPVLEMAEREAAGGLRGMDAYSDFGAAVARSRDELNELLDGYRRAGKRVVGYGASAKGNTLLNYCRIGPDTLGYVVDRNPLKVGRFTPGTHIPVRDVDILEAQVPDAILVLAWNYADEIIDQLAWLRDRGTDFIVPVPHARVM
ncbi:MAG: class I SAM-dependent methyltransferase [Longimicrobiales bacterium]